MIVWTFWFTQFTSRFKLFILAVIITVFIIIISKIQIIEPWSGSCCCSWFYFSFWFLFIYRSWCLSIRLFYRFLRWTYRWFLITPIIIIICIIYTFINSISALFNANFIRTFLYINYLLGRYIYTFLLNTLDCFAFLALVIKEPIIIIIITKINVVITIVVVVIHIYIFNLNIDFIIYRITKTNINYNSKYY